MDLHFRSPFEQGITAHQSQTASCGTITVIEDDPSPPGDGNGNGEGTDTTMVGAAALVALVIAYIVLR